MYLTKEEERMLNSENETISKAMEIIVKIGELFGAEKLIRIESAHISGISYQNIGDEGLEWLESLKAKVRVKTTINPAGMDLKRWRDFVDEKFYEKQLRILNALRRIGAELTLTCTPYYIHKPNLGEHLAWAESSAVVYANSIIGARTNRESGISAIASAITGRTPYYGLHITENRAPTVLVKVKGDLSLAGYIAGSELHNEIPYFVLHRAVTEYELKLLGASLAATGNIAMFHVEGITPEWDKFEKPREKYEVEVKTEKSCEADLIVVGCPHVSEEELKLILKTLNGRKVKKNLWIFCSRVIANKCKTIVKEIEKLGAKVYCDTCIVVSPVVKKFKCVMTNSGKVLAYLPKLKKVDVVFSDLKSCIEYAVQN